jgi:Glycosyl transferases group 1
VTNNPARIGPNASTATPGRVADRPVAWLASFGPVGSSADGYLIRVEANAQALASLGYAVHVLEVSKRNEATNPWPHVTTHPAAPWLVAKRHIFGPMNILADVRGQFALVAGLFRHWSSLRSASLVVVEGGLLALTCLISPFRRKGDRVLVFDLITLMSSLHRDGQGKCTFQCKARRRIWRVLELVCVRFSDVSVAGSSEDARDLHQSRVKVVPHALFTNSYVNDTSEDPNLIGFLGSGHVVPNREALAFIVSSVLQHPGLESLRCRVIGREDGYENENPARVEFVGFHKDPAAALADVSVGCAPMEGAGGVSTKVLAYLMHGKRTVCTREAAHGITWPPFGLWVADRDNFARSVADALDFPWSSAESNSLRAWMRDNHGLGGLEQAWHEVLSRRD